MPRPMLTDSIWTSDGWDLGVSDRKLLADRKAGYVPAAVAARLHLPPEGVAGEVTVVRHHPDTGDPAGFDVAADLELGPSR